MVENFVIDEELDPILEGGIGVIENEIKDEIEIIEDGVAVIENNQDSNWDGFEVAIFRLRGLDEEFTLSGDDIKFIPRVETIYVRNPIEDYSFIIKKDKRWSKILNVVLFVKIREDNNV